MAGVQNPRDFATDADVDAAFMVEVYGALDVRPGMQVCFERLGRGKMLGLLLCIRGMLRLLRKMG